MTVFICLIFLGSVQRYFVKTMIEGSNPTFWLVKQVSNIEAGENELVIILLFSFESFS